jgi:glucose/arabinose dehydrogenase/azurin
MACTDRRARRLILVFVAVVAIAGIAELKLRATGEGSGEQIRPEPNRGGAIDLAARDPRIALARLHPAKGYEIGLFASDREFPDLAKPIALTFDARGRLWVMTSPTYPHYLPGVRPNDKLLILEDTNRDGRADKVTVFADGLYQPMGFELGDGGVYISQEPNLVFLRDTNGDDRADERRIILHGFGTEDSHHAIHAFTWGPGGELYFQEGTFLHSQVETPYGPVRLAEAGVFRYEPRTEKLSVFVSYPFANPWGHIVDRWGQNFVSDASNGNNYYGTPFSGHVDYPRKQRTMQVWTLTQVRPTAANEFVRSRQFPDEAQGNFLINNVIGFQGIKQYRVQEEGSGFVALETEPLLQSEDPNFRPIGMQFGPDGALYFVDWFNPLIGHMQYSLRDPRRDHAYGRVWRITAKGRPLLDPPRIHDQPIEAQLELLKAYEDRTRYRVRRALREQPTAAVVKALQGWVAKLDPADAEYEHHLLEALWVYQHHDTVEPALLNRLLQAKEFRARAAATRVLQQWFDRVDGAMALLKRLVNDPAPRVRLEAVRALSFIPTREAAEAALDVLRHPTDYYLQFTLDATMTTLEKVWKPILTSGRPFSADNSDGLAFVLARLEPSELASAPRSIPVFRAMLERPGIEPRIRQQALDGLSSLNGTKPLQELIAAIDRLDGTPGSGQPTHDLAQMLVAGDPPALSGARTDLERLALQARNDAARQAGFAALMRADGSVTRAWELASASPRSRIDLLRGASRFTDDRLLGDLYPRISAQLADVSGAPSRQTAPPVQGRYVRIVFPGPERTLRLAEVQVFSSGENVAPKGSAAQSSTVPGIGGQAARAIDGVTDSDPKAESVAFTSLERNPWWEVDLGETRPIDAVTIWNPQSGGTSRADGVHLSVMDATRKPVFTQDGLSAGTSADRIVLGGDVTAILTNAAITALASIPGHEAESVGLLTRFVPNPASREAAIAAIRRIPKASWPVDQLTPLADAVVAYVRTVPASERTGAAFKQAVEFGRELAGRVPAAEGQRIARAIDELVVRTIRIEAVRAAMKFSIAQFPVAAGEEIEIEFVNADDMPHNLLVTAPGTLESVGLKAEAMIKEADAFAKGFIPETPEVLFGTKLINVGETARLRFTAPARPGSYPFVCTFPGHWRTMNGTMQVTRGTTPTGG